jgi:hypothetical protein
MGCLPRQCITPGQNIHLRTSWRPAKTGRPSRENGCSVTSRRSARPAQDRCPAAPSTSSAEMSTFNPRAYLCTKWNTHLRSLDLADDRREAFSIVLAGKPDHCRIFVADTRGCHLHADASVLCGPDLCIYWSRSVCLDLRAPDRKLQALLFGWDFPCNWCSLMQTSVDPVYAKRMNGSCLLFRVSLDRSGRQRGHGD